MQPSALTRAALAVILTAVTACGLHSPIAVTAVSPAERTMYEWNDDRGPGEVAVVINLSSQRAYYSRGGRPIGWSYVATGKEGKNTPAGSYTITEKIADKYSNLYGWIETESGVMVDPDASPGDPVPSGGRYVAAPMPYWMRLTSGGIGMHGGLIPRPGSPASHGCIRLPKPFAPVLFEVIKVGTPVSIEYGPARPPAPAPQRIAPAPRPPAPWATPPARPADAPLIPPLPSPASRPAAPRPRQAPPAPRPFLPGSPFYDSPSNVPLGQPR